MITFFIPFLPGTTCISDFIYHLENLLSSEKSTHIKTYTHR